MPANPHFYLHTFLRGLVTATTDEALNGTADSEPYEVVDALYKALEELNGILEDIADHLYEEEENPIVYEGARADLPDFVEQDLNYYAGLEL